MKAGQNLTLDKFLKPAASVLPPFPPRPPLLQVVQAAIVQLQLIWSAHLWGVSGAVLPRKSLHALWACTNPHGLV